MKHWKDGPEVATDLVSYIASTRSIDNIDRFIQPIWPDDLHDPFLLPDAGRAAQRLIEGIEKREKIGIVGDYDMDGTPGAALLYEFFKKWGNEAVVILPTRSQGYGFSPEFVERLNEQGVSLIITVDCGIRDFAAIERANALHCDVIIIDHHECDTILPPAFAIINPKRVDSHYPFRELCGTGVAFKFLQAVAQMAKSVNVEKQLAWSLDLVALATLGDMVSLKDENRVLVYYGLKVLQKTKRLGLRRLFQTMKVDLNLLTYRDIAYKIIPKLNASGRLESMDDVFTLLVSSDKEVIDAAIKRILIRDTQRQLLSDTVYKQAKIKLENDTLPSILIFYDPSWHPGVTGIVATRLSSEYDRPVGVLGSLDGELYRGSMRANGVNLPDLLTQVEVHLEKFGGHNEAAGLAVRSDQIEKLKQTLESVNLPKEETISIITDGTIQPELANRDTIERLDQFSPWGIGNEEPFWSLCHVHLEQIRWIGSSKNHLKGVIRWGEGSIDCIYFGAEKLRSFDYSQPIDLYGSLSINEFNGQRNVQMMIKDLTVSQE